MSAEDETAVSLSQTPRTRTRCIRRTRWPPLSLSPRECPPSLSPRDAPPPLSHLEVAPSLTHTSRCPPPSLSPRGGLASSLSPRGGPLSQTHFEVPPPLSLSPRGGPLSLSHLQVPPPLTHTSRRPLSHTHPIDEVPLSHIQTHPVVVRGVCGGRSLSITHTLTSLYHTHTHPWY